MKRNRLSDLEQVVYAVVSSKKYHMLCEDTVRRIAARELAHHTSFRVAVKATKRKLHQVYAAFEQDVDYDVEWQRLEAAYRLGSCVEVQAACRRVLGLHSSTRERLSFLDRFYAAVFEVTGHPASLLDLGCGLHPLALPWMGLAPSTRYIALDIDTDRIRFLNRYLALAGWEPLARCQDVLVHPPADDADLAFLLKMGPSLERQEEGATLRLIEQLRVPFVVISFAVMSLGGLEKGMVDHYRQQFLNVAANQRWAVDELAFETELVFVVRKRLADDK